jgi:hypothetical protein
MRTPPSAALSKQHQPRRLVGLLGPGRPFGQVAASPAAGRPVVRELGLVRPDARRQLLAARLVGGVEE